MSASFNKEQNKFEFLYKGPNKLSPKEEAIIFCKFDTETDKDVQISKNLEMEKKTYKRFCIYKILIFIPEYSCTLLLFGKEVAKERFQLIKYCWNFLFNKVSLTVFKKYYLKG